MITSVTLQKFRGFDGVTIPLTRVTMLTGANGIGKTSVLEGLYCLFSETELDVGPLCRYDRTVIASEWEAENPPFVSRRFGNHVLFWNECLAFDGRSCYVSAESDDGASWMWTCTKCVMSELDDTLQYEAQRVHASASTCDFAVFSWALRRMASGGEPVELKMTKAQFLDPTVSRPMCSHICDIIPRACCYVDFATVRAFAWDDALTYTKELAQALKLFDNRITGVSTTGFPSSLSVIVDNSQEISLGALGTGAVAWTGTLMKMLGTVERHSDDNHASDLNTPIFVLIDQVGAGIHHSAMDDIWAYFRRLADMHPHVQFVMTSHGDDSVRAFCKAFNIDGDSASVVTMHRTYDGDFVRTQVEQPKFKNITSGRWEVR